MGDKDIMKQFGRTFRQLNEGDQKPFREETANRRFDRTYKQIKEARQKSLEEAKKNKLELIGNIELKKEFQEGDKVLVLSDLHLTHKLNQQVLDTLMAAVSDYNKVVLNGDIYDDYVVDDERKREGFLENWGSFFETLSKKEDVTYLRGNHDWDKFSETISTKYGFDFGDVLEAKFGDEEVIFKHGQDLPSIAGEVATKDKNRPYGLGYMASSINYPIDKFVSQFETGFNLLKKFRNEGWRKKHYPALWNTLGKLKNAEAFLKPKETFGTDEKGYLKKEKIQEYLDSGVTEDGKDLSKEEKEFITEKIVEYYTDKVKAVRGKVWKYGKEKMVWAGHSHSGGFDVENNYFDTGFSTDGPFSFGSLEYKNGKLSGQLLTGNYKKPDEGMEVFAQMEKSVSESR